MRKDPRVYLAHILECLVRIEDYTRDGKEGFLAKRVIQDAVARISKLWARRRDGGRNGLAERDDY